MLPYEILEIISLKSDNYYLAALLKSEHVKNKIVQSKNFLFRDWYTHDLSLIKWLHKYNVKCTTKAMDYASRFGHLEIVKFLHENRQEGYTENAMDFASENGHLEIVKFLHENRQEGCTKNAINYASVNGH